MRSGSCLRSPLRLCSAAVAAIGSLAVAATIAPPAAAQVLATVSVNPQATYLRRGSGAHPTFAPNTDQPVVDPVPINLTSLGILSGQRIILTRLGAFALNAPPVDTATNFVGVFSSSSTLITGPLNSPDPDAFDTLNRVVGAVEAGADFVTPNTLFGDMPTDIPQDFFIFGGAGTSIIVPTGAAFLFVSPSDSFFSDNSDPNGDFRVQVSVAPEPATLTLLATGLLPITGALIRRRRHGLLCGCKKA